MPLITSATNTGLSIKQLAISAAPLRAAAAAAAIPPAKKYAVEEQSFSTILNNATGLLANVNNISSINVKDTGVLSLTKAQYKDNASLISKLSGNRQFKITDAVTMEEMSALVKNKNVVNIAAVTDTAANIEAGMGTLISNNEKLNAASITKTVPAADIAISSANYKKANAAGGVLSKFAAGSFTAANLNVTGVSASDVAGILSDTTKVKTVSITDSVANIFNNAASLTTNIAKVGTVTATAAKTPFMRIEATGANGYAAYTAANSGLITKVNAGNANALKDAFVLTGALIADVTVGIIGDTQVKSVEVADTAANAVAATTAVLSKVTKADLTADKADVDSTLLTQLAGLGSKLSSLKLNAGEGDTLDGLDASNIRNKATAVVLAKTKGEHGDPIGLEVTGAKLADVNGLLANKQVNKATIEDTAKNVLAFSANKFTILANSKNVTKITISDSAANISKYHTHLASAVKQFNTDRVNLSVTDTAANLEANLTALDEVATAITGADAQGQSKYDNSRIKIVQTDATALIKVSYESYTQTADASLNNRRDVLQYIKDATIAMTSQKHIQIDTAGTTTAISVQRAKDISTTMRWVDYIDDRRTGGTMVAPVATSIALDAGTLAGGVNNADATTFNGNTIFSDVAKIDITLKGAKAAADYAKVVADKDLLNGAGNFLRTGVTIGSINMYA